jgi:hypothetical protein
LEKDWGGQMAKGVRLGSREMKMKKSSSLCLFSLLLILPCLSCKKNGYEDPHRSLKVNHGKIFKVGNDDAKTVAVHSVESDLKKCKLDFTKSEIIDLLGVPDVINEDEWIYYYAKNSEIQSESNLRLKFNGSKLFEVESDMIFAGYDFFEPSPDVREAEFVKVCRQFSEKRGGTRYAEACFLVQYIKPSERQYTADFPSRELGQPDIQDENRIHYVVFRNSIHVCYLEFLCKDSVIYRVDLNDVYAFLYETMFAEGKKCNPQQPHD